MSARTRAPYEPITDSARRTTRVISIGAVAPRAPIPIATTRAPSRSISVAWTSVTGRPIASKATSTPPPVSARTASTASPALASTTSVADELAALDLERQVADRLDRVGAGPVRLGEPADLERVR